MTYSGSDRVSAPDLTANPLGPDLPAPERTPAPTPLIESMVIVALAVAVLSLFLFAWIANEMAEGSTAGFDLSVRAWVH